jgi:hypothetical protein
LFDSPPLVELVNREPRDEVTDGGAIEVTVAHLFAVPAANFEAVAAPTQVAREHDDLAVVRAHRLYAVARQQ